MCLLIELNAATRFTDEFLDGVYRRNSDGIGVMWAEDNHLHYYKALPKDAAEARSIFRQYAEGKHCCVHYRMRTHGDIDMTNCHPYPVMGFDGHVADMPVLLMHNGVLSTGNSKDTSKSDTYHYIEDYIRPILETNPAMLYSEPFLKMVAAHIGNSNKFAMMDASGHTVILNRHAGIEYEGSWLSNQYAWDYYGLHPDAPKYAYPSKSSNYLGSSYWGNTTSHKPASKIVPRPALKSVTKPTPKTTKAKTTPSQLRLPMPEPIKAAVQRVMDQLMEEHPDAAEKVTFANVSKVYTDLGVYDAEDFFDLFFYGTIDEETFIDCVKKPIKAQRLVNETWMDNNKLRVGL